jgi:hypothetical protein
MKLLLIILLAITSTIVVSSSAFAQLGCAQLPPCILNSPAGFAANEVKIYVEDVLNPVCGNNNQPPGCPRSVCKKLTIEMPPNDCFCKICEVDFAVKQPDVCNLQVCSVSPDCPPAPVMVSNGGIGPTHPWSSDQCDWSHKNVFTPCENCFCCISNDPGRPNQTTKRSYILCWSSDCRRQDDTNLAPCTMTPSSTCEKIKVTIHLDCTNTNPYSSTLWEDPNTHIILQADSTLECCSYVGSTTPVSYWVCW